MSLILSAAALHDQLAAAGVPVLTVRQTNGVLSIVYADAATQQQRDQGDAILAAFVPQTVTQQTAGQALAILANNDDGLARITRAVALAAMDGDNVLRAWVANFVAAVAAATSLADLKTRVAALGGLAQLTAANVKAAVANRVSTPDADA